MEGSNAAFWLALLGMLVGLAGTILPALPGIGLIWIAALIYALVDGFTTLTPLAFVALTLLALIGIVADFFISQAGSKIAGASWQALGVGVLLGIVGFLFGLFFGGIGAVPGGIIGTLAGIFAVEYRRRNDVRGALKASGGYLVGCIVSGGVQFVLALVMVGLFIWQVGVRGGAIG